MDKACPPFLVLAALAAIVSVSCTPATETVLESFVADLRAAAGTDTTTLQDARILRVLTIPDHNRYTLESPSLIASDGACTLAVVDGDDRAIHLFDSEGAYRSSRDKRKHPGSIASLFLPGDSTVVTTILEYGPKTVTVWPLTEGDPKELVLEPAPSDSTSRSRVVLDGSVVAEHWFASGLETPSGDWPQRQLPLIRFFEKGGPRLLGSAGSVVGYPGHTLTSALNRGLIAIARDTLWFVRVSTGEIFQVPMPPVASSDTLALVRRIPLRYTPTPPREVLVKARNAYSHSVELQVVGFDVTREGRYFAILQVLRYRKPPDLHRPIVGVRLSDRLEDKEVLLGVEGEITSVALLGDSRIAVRVLTRDSTGSVARILLLENPLAPIAEGKAECHR